MSWLWRQIGSFSIRDIKYTERVVSTLFSLGGAMIAAIFLYGAFRAVSLGRIELGAAFIFWGLAVAFVAFLTGGCLGMLFGLPTARRVEVTSAPAPGAAGGATPAPTSVSTGYVESTSLEQIADFLVKGLIAISLTTFSHWVTQFDILAGNVTATLMSSPKCVAAKGVVCPVLPDRVPGGLLLAGFALLGFLIGYLWMRRWFIAEMVTARREERDIVRDEEDRVEQARKAGLVGKGASNGNDADSQTVVAKRMAALGVESAGEDAREDAKRISDELVRPGGDPDDPWKGVFGGSVSNGGYVISANVAALVSDPDNFQVDLLVMGVDPRKRPALAGKSAHFYLHPTFGSKPRDVAFDGDGKAALQLFSYGAFTVGVLIDDGTRLELDLAQLPGAPAKFVAR